MATNLPIYQPYGTVSNAYQSVMGSGPIQYNTPLSNLRQQTNAPQINPLGDVTSQDRIRRDATRLAERNLSQLYSQGEQLRLSEPNRIAAMDEYELTPYEQRNFNRLQLAGYGREYSFANAGSGGGADYRPSSSQGQFIQGNFDRNQRDQRITQTLLGYQPSSQVQNAYQRFMNRL